MTISSGLGKTSFVRGVAEAQQLIQVKIEYNLTRVPGVICPGTFLPLDDKEDTLIEIVPLITHFKANKSTSMGVM